MPIHSTAIIDKSAEIDPTADIGAYAVIDGRSHIGPRCKIWHHAFISWGTTLGADVQVHPFAVVGHHPQDIAWKETPSFTTIGDGTIIREHASIHRGTPPETTTVVGKRCFIMSTGHIGHNCVVGDEVKIVNGGLLSGWVTVGDKSFISGNAAVQQFTRIGEYCMIGGMTRVTCDVAPFMMASPGGVIGLNVVGLRRNGFSAADRNALRLAYKTIFRSGTLLSKALERVEQSSDSPAVRRLVEFMRGPAKRGFMRFYGSGRNVGGEGDE